MFSSSGVFRQIPCPLPEDCNHLNCIFNHDERSAQRSRQPMPSDIKEPQAKKSKTTHPRDRLAETASTPESQQHREVRRSAETSLTTLSKKDSTESTSAVAANSAGTKAQRPISPPPVNRRKDVVESGTDSSTSLKRENLNPRNLPKPPAAHATRLILLQKLHEEMTRLNNETKQSQDEATKVSSLTDGELITLALDEEENLARDHPSIYSNLIKQRIMAFKKMTLEDWKSLRAAAITAAKTEGGNQGLKSKEAQEQFTLETGLTAADEVEILSQLVTDQTTLAKYGYVTSPPTEEQVKSAQEVVDIAHGWEKCDRCERRFQVFPERREDGSLTSGGKCTYHYGRLRAAAKDRPGQKEKKYSCCNEPIGASSGCTTAESHVFKSKDAEYLAAVMQFERTRENLNPKPEPAVCFDCEMAYTVCGMELIRVTALAWPSGKELLDVLVRPLGALLDLNTRYSGIRQSDFVDAVPYGRPGDENSNEKGLRVVESPFVARDLLFDLISPSTILIGHSLENDLNAMRIVHPRIVDTVFLFPHPAGLPRRLPLKALAKGHLKRNIQVAGAQGHNSKEDAEATGDLVRLKVWEKWKKLQPVGRRFEQAKIQAPAEGAKAGPGIEEQERSQAGRKRVHEEVAKP